MGTRFAVEEARIESECTFVFFMDLFEICLSLNNVAKAEKYLIEADITIAEISKMEHVIQKKEYFLTVAGELRKKYDMAKEKLDAVKTKHEAINTEQSTCKI